MNREWTDEETKRLVPEGFIHLSPHGMVRDSSLVVAHALLQTRLDLETAQKELKALRTTMAKIATHDFETTGNWKDDARQFQEWARESLEGRPE